MKLVYEIVGGETYEYYPLGKHVVAAPKVCGGRPTFKHTRLEVKTVLDLMASGWTMEKILSEYNQSRLKPEAIREALRLAGDALLKVGSAEKLIA
ncbi:DUF433 domain-containing protein [Candidatus Poribacteria bacterium]|nr:DUF433 domain-containing protein [Candidatus Poribacteria bacterium]